MGADPAVDAFREAVRSSAALVFVTPEYNGGPSALIKNALDHVSRPRGNAPVADKPVAVLGATPAPGAASGARAALATGLQIAGARPVKRTYGVGDAFRHLGPQGYDASVHDEVAAVVDTLIQAADGYLEQVA